MRYALISDIHANLPALEAVLANIAARADVDATYHLGDLVGYAPWPDETVERLRVAGIAGVAGNYDSTVATHAPHCGCRYEDPRQEELSHLSYAWTLAHTSPATKSFLGALPFRIDLRPLGGHASGPTVTLLHGNQVLNTVYVHAERSDDFLAKMGAAVGVRAGDVVCVGHTHIHWHRVVDGIHFVNTGSVGRPDDGTDVSGYYMPRQQTWWPNYFTDYGAYLNSMRRLAGLGLILLLVGSLIGLATVTAPSAPGGFNATLVVIYVVMFALAGWTPVPRTVVWSAGMYITAAPTTAAPRGATKRISRPTSAVIPHTFSMRASDSPLATTSKWTLTNKAQRMPSSAKAITTIRLARSGMSKENDVELENQRGGQLSAPRRVPDGFRTHNIHIHSVALCH